MSDYCDIGGPEFYAESEHVSRKERTCIECNAPILVGERYLSCRGRWDGGDFQGMAQHLLCRDACVWVRDTLNDSCLCFGGLAEFWQETRRPCELQDYFASYGRDGRKETSPEQRRRMDSNWRIGARMFAMIRRRERTASLRTEVAP